MQLHQISDKPQPVAVLSGWPVLRLGFRPFYLTSALLACLSVPVWAAVFLGYFDMKLELSPLLWHGHEMLFGFAAGVIAGFLLTAVPEFTGLPSIPRRRLHVLVALWLGGRLAFTLDRKSVV